MRLLSCLGVWVVRKGPGSRFVVGHRPEDMAVLLAGTVVVVLVGRQR